MLGAQHVFCALHRNVISGPPRSSSGYRPYQVREA